MVKTVRQNLEIDPSWPSDKVFRLSGRLRIAAIPAGRSSVFTSSLTSLDSNDSASHGKAGQRGRQIFAGMVLGEQAYLDLWKKLNPLPPTRKFSVTLALHNHYCGYVRLSPFARRNQALAKQNPTVPFRRAKRNHHQLQTGNKVLT
ncbi:MAG: hypothetical protein ACK53L_14300, partial [Pirellulaceae bacterium]